MKIDPSRLRHVEEVAERAAAEVQGLRHRQADLSEVAARANFHLRSEEERLSSRSSHIFPGTKARRDKEGREDAAQTVLGEARAKAVVANEELDRNAVLLSEAVERHNAARQLAAGCQEFVTNGNQEAAQ